MVSLKRARLGRWVPAAVAGSTLIGGCTGRTFDFGFGTDGNGGSGDSGDSESGDPTNPTDPTVDPTTNPTDPTDPTDPTIDPTDPTGELPEPPQLINVAFLDNLTLQLTFSEPMAAVDAVDPSVFRLSLALGYTESYKGYTRTFYQEVGYFNDNNQYCYEEYCNENCYYDKRTGEKYCYEYCYDYCPYEVQFVNAIAIRNDSADATKIQLVLDPGIGSGVCEAYKELPPEYSGGLFLHYTDDRPPLPSDTQGQGLFPIGEDWVLQGDSFRDVQGFFPQLNPMLPIPCPF